MKLQSRLISATHSSSPLSAPILKIMILNPPVLAISLNSRTYMAVKNWNVGEIRLQPPGNSSTFASPSPKLTSALIQS